MTRKPYPLPPFADAYFRLVSEGLAKEEAEKKRRQEEAEKAELRARLKKLEKEHFEKMAESPSYRRSVLENQNRREAERERRTAEHEARKARNDSFMMDRIYSADISSVSGFSDDRVSCRTCDGRGSYVGRRPGITDCVDCGGRGWSRRR